MNNNICGLILINKEEGMTSQNVVNRVKRLLAASKAGHTGTLDPMATGVLPVLVGRAVKAGEYLLSSRKSYRATLLLGRETDTEDTSGTTLRETDDIPCEKDVYAACYALRGDSMQIPPMYSAIRVGGKRLMELAREGKTVEREPRPITVYRLDATRTGERTYALDVECSKGTYIRTLCADIGRSLGCGGCMAALCRTEAAGYPLSVCYTLEEIETMSLQERQALLIPVEDIFADWEAVILPDFFARLAHNGLPIYLRKIGRNDPVGKRVRMYDKNGFFALGEVGEAEDGMAIKPLKQFG